MQVQRMVNEEVHKHVLPALDPRPAVSPLFTPRGYCSTLQDKPAPVRELSTPTEELRTSQTQASLFWLLNFTTPFLAAEWQGPGNYGISLVAPYWTYAACTGAVQWTRLQCRVLVTVIQTGFCFL